MSSSQRPPLTAAFIAQQALGLVDRVGLDALTMRLLAQELDVKSPALYWHFRNKQQLLERMAEQLYLAGGMGAPLADETWEQWVLRRSLAYRNALNSVRDGALVAAAAKGASATLIGLFDEEVTALVDFGFTPALALHTIAVITHYISGFVVKEQGAAAGGPSAENAMPVMSATLAAAFRDGGSPLSEEVFVHGIRMIIAGARAELEA